MYVYYMVNKKIMYFGHPVNTYNTFFEEELVNVIQKKFPDWQIENPNQQKHQDGYLDWKKKTGNGMDYYFKEVLPSVDGGIFLPFADGRFGAGVFGEAQRVWNLKGGVWTISYLNAISKVKNFSDLQSLALPVDETRQRIYVDGKRENGMRDFFV